MAKVNLRSNNNTSPHGRSSLLFKVLLQLPALVIGIMVGQMMMVTTTTTNTDSASSSSGSSAGLRSMSELETTTSASSSSSSLQGWKEIHVFYGDQAGLNVKPEEKWFAQVHQDEILMDLIGKDGYFIDLAANDAKEWTNTLALEREGNWNGLCIEPNPTYWYGLSHRKCTVIGALVGGTTMEKVQVKFRGVYGGIVGKISEQLANRKKEPKAPIEERYTAPFAQLLSKFNVPSIIDYLSLDVEGAEYLIMQNFPFDKYQIKILTVERPNDQLKTLLNQHGYHFLKDLAWWGETLWAHESTGLTPQHPKIAKIQTEERN